MEKRKFGGFKLSEDWLATLIGLGIVALIAVGIIGPGPQSVALTAAPGETVEAEVPATTGWRAEARFADGTILDFSETVERTQRTAFYEHICEDGALRLGNAASAQFPTLALRNECDQTVTLTYRRSGAIPWPVFGIFD